MLTTNLIIASPPIRAGIEPQVDTNIFRVHSRFQNCPDLARLPHFLVYFVVLLPSVAEFSIHIHSGMDVESNASVSQTIVQNSQRKPHSSGRILAVDGVNAANY